MSLSPSLRFHTIFISDFLVTGNVLKDLSFPPSLDLVVLSEEEGIEKPSREIFDKVLGYVNRNRCQEKGRMEIEPNECLHVGDEVEWYALPASFPTF